MMYIYISIYLCVCMCVCMCICMCVLNITNHYPSLSSNSSLTRHNKPKVKLGEAVSYKRSVKKVFLKFMKMYNKTSESESLFK